MDCEEVDELGMKPVICVDLRLAVIFSNVLIRFF